MKDIIYLYELKYYSERELKKSFGEENYHKIIEELGKRGILKLKDRMLALEYVGLLIIGEKIISVLPKFLKGEEIDKKETSLLILKTLQKYAKASEEKFNLLEVTEENGLSKISLISQLFKDFIDYGLYSSEKEVYEINGGGDIDWEMTIENIDPLVLGDTSYYLDLYTLETDSNEDHYIRRLHQSILVRALEYLESLEIIDFIDDAIEIPNFDFISTEDGLGDPSYQVTMIENQLREEYGERKIVLLKSMKNFIEDNELDSDDSLELLGVNKFWSVWEAVSQDVFGNNYSRNNKLGEIVKKIYNL